jgi:serine/threonine protein kinase
MNSQILIIAGPDKGRVFQLEEGQSLVIGRGQSSHTKINDPYMSRMHCEIEVENSKATLIDSGGKNTLVKGAAVDRHELQPGDEFQAGNTVFRYSLGTSADDKTWHAPAGANAGGAPAPKPRTPAMKELVGQTFANFHLDSVLAVGGSGYVFKATDTEKNRIAAVKVLYPERMANDEEKERFVRAMKTMLPIRHPNIVALWNAGKNGPFCWAAMEFIDGESLTEVIHRIGVNDMLDWRDVWRVGVDIASALEKAFEQKVIHRNVTPANILRRRSDKVCLLGDLMLAKALEGTLAKQVTSPGRLLGELPYIPPERTRDGQSVDIRSDIYGLGATMYALLAGKPPFESDSTGELIRMIRESEPVPPKKYQLAINEQFQAVVLRMLSKRPEDRFANPSLLLEELERVGKYQGLTIKK